MKIGITGTRYGMNEYQATAVKEMLANFMQLACEKGETLEFHHGDCVGVDAEAAVLAKHIGYKVVSHPGPDAGELRAFVECDECREPQTHFKRNRTIVDTCDLLIVVPFQNEHQARGGTWYTHDYAQKTGKELIVVYPNPN